MMSIRRKIQPTASMGLISFEGICHKKGYGPADGPGNDGSYARTTFFEKSVQHKASIG